MRSDPMNFANATASMPPAPGPLRRLLWLSAAIALAACAAEPSDPEAELREWLSAAEAEAEERDRSALMERIAEGYADGRGNDFRAIEQMMRFYLLRQKNVSLLTAIESIDVVGETAADVRLTVAMAGTGGQAGFSADAWRFALELQKQDDDWLLIGAKWGQLGEELR